MKTLEQSKYLSKEEAIERLAIDLVVNDSILSFTHKDMRMSDYLYCRLDLIDENMHQGCRALFVSDFLDYKSAGELRADYFEFLIDRAVFYITKKMGESYRVEVK